MDLPFVVKYKIYFNLDYSLKEQTKKNNGEKAQDQQEWLLEYQKQFLTLKTGTRHEASENSFCRH